MSTCTIHACYTSLEPCKQCQTPRHQSSYTMARHLLGSEVCIVKGEVLHLAGSVDVTWTAQQEIFQWCDLSH